MPRKPASKIDIDVVPYLSIMVIVLKLICLILVVTVMKIALNPQGVRAVSITGMYAKETKGTIKIPTYFDCSPGGVTIVEPDVSTNAVKVIPADLALPGNGVEMAIRKITAHATNHYAIALVRPRGIRVYRHVRKLLTEANVDIGFDVYDSDVEINFAGAAKDAGIKTEETEHAQDQKR